MRKNEIIDTAFTAQCKLELIKTVIETLINMVEDDGEVKASEKAMILLTSRMSLMIFFTSRMTAYILRFRHWTNYRTAASKTRNANMSKI